MGTRAVRTLAPPSFSALLTSVLMLCLPGSSAEATDDIPSATAHIVARLAVPGGYPHAP
ncbi:hypothetical protein JCM12681A_26380 [Streptomyces mexicanus]